MAMMHNSLMNYYETIFALKQYHGWAISEIYDMLPWELEVNLALLGNYLEAQKLQQKQQAAQG